MNRDVAELDPTLRTLDGFKRHRNRALFGTNDPRSLKFRFRRQLAYQLMRYEPERFGDYPELLSEMLSAPQRFEVIYREDRPWSRIDREDADMLGYDPTREDLEWDPEAFLRQFLTPADCRALGIAAEWPPGAPRASHVTD